MSKCNTINQTEPRLNTNERAAIKRKATEELEELGKQIAAHAEKIKRYVTQAEEKVGVDLRKAADHGRTIESLLPEARAKCKAAGMSFRKFREKFPTSAGPSFTNFSPLPMAA